MLKLVVVVCLANNKVNGGGRTFILATSLFPGRDKQKYRIHKVAALITKLILTAFVSRTDSRTYPYYRIAGQLTGGSIAFIPAASLLL